MDNNLVQIFIAYSKKDIYILEELKNHLVFLERKALAKIWYDGLIEPGVNWDQEIKYQLLNSKIILLLLSSDFISSDYCYNNELQHALKLHEYDKATVIPIIARKCMWEHTELGAFECLPTKGKAITSKLWEDEDEPFVNIASSLYAKILSYYNQAYEEDKLNETKINETIFKAKSIDKQDLEKIKDKIISTLLHISVFPTKIRATINPNYLTFELYLEAESTFNDLKKQLFIEGLEEKQLHGFACVNYLDEFGSKLELNIFYENLEKL